MKKSIIIKSALVLALFTGCSFKSNPINLGEPQMSYKGATSPGKMVNLKSVTNANPTGNIVGIVKDSKGNIISEIPTSQVLNQWFDGAIRAQFSMAGLNMSSESKNIVDIKLTKVELVYIDDTFNTKNLNVKVTAEMKLANTKGTVTREYNLEDNKYNGTISGSSELTPYLKDLLTKLTAAMTRDAVNFAGTI
ncbi:MAG: hypothetical protein RL154_747 [Pseudomonadota bacterium]